MINSIKARTPFLAFILTAFSIGYTFAHNKVVVVPLAGDTFIPGVSVIPSGTTVKGNINWDTHETVNGADYFYTIDTLGILSQAIDNTSVNFSADGLVATIDDDATCTGSLQDPTAPPGKICLYLLTTVGVNNLQGIQAVPLTDRGFRVAWTSTGVGDMFFVASWAYTAP